MTWKNTVKDILLIIFSSLFFVPVVAVGYMQNSEWNLGVILLTVASVLWVIIYLIADYWHKQDIHSTFFGRVVAVFIVVVSPFVAWHYGFPLWPLSLILAYVLFSFFINKKGKKTPG